MTCRNFLQKQRLFSLQISSALKLSVIWIRYDVNQKSQQIESIGKVLDRNGGIIPYEVWSSGFFSLQAIIIICNPHGFDHVFLLSYLEVLFWQDRIMHFPTWVDLKGQDAVPETVHHVVICNLIILQRFFLYPFKCLQRKFSPNSVYTSSRGNSL